MLAKRAEQVGIAAFTWHDVRRTAAGDLLDMEADIMTVQRLLGHADRGRLPGTTAGRRRPSGRRWESCTSLT
ncbi:MAG: tyrosine-type recombinase/integrase, partial [Chloroflexota bacterium]